jgi:peroxiredoxin Q/BCP
MNPVEIDQAVPEFSATATGNQIVRLADFRGRNLILYFYPKDNTPGCTLEGQQFRDRYAEFRALSTEVLGVSRDSLLTHERFRSKHDFPFALISDKDATLCKLFNVIKPKKLYGKESMGVERSTFLIDKNGILRHEWRKVKVSGHVEAVLVALKQLS